MTVCHNLIKSAISIPAHLVSSVTSDECIKFYLLDLKSKPSCSHKIQVHAFISCLIPSTGSSRSRSRLRRIRWRGRGRPEDQEAEGYRGRRPPRRRCQATGEAPPFADSPLRSKSREAPLVRRVLRSHLAAAQFLVEETI